ncbi:MAG TPA: SAM-dependent methyltransferase [Opitutaceae bacterium]|nr:SAM-dependent methyltransferase [Opitutaceae bacterium]
MPDDTLQHVSDTALWVAHYRAEESERPDALFHDPYAKRLAGERGRRFAENMGPTSRYTRWTLVIRTVIIDRFIEAAIRDAGIDTVLNLGAGLDSRPYRMTSLPASLRWIEVDHPQIIDHKESLLAAEKPRCRLERIRLDLADRPARQRLLADISRTSGRVLVLTEGVLPYLTESAVSDLAADLHAQPNLPLWIAEYFALESYRYLNHPRQRHRMRNTPFRFFPPDWLAFFRTRGWLPQETRYIGVETKTLGRRAPYPWFAHILRLLIPRDRWQRAQRMTGYILFSRSTDRVAE